MYHVLQCAKHGLIEIDKSDAPNIVIYDLSPRGHEFLAVSRNKRLWGRLNKILAKVGAESLSAAIQIAAQLLLTIIRRQFLL